METLEYYKLKDELSALIKDEISKSLGNERDLQQRYIGIGLKIAAGGIAAAFLTLGVFGIKSFYEVDSSIKKIPAIINKRTNDEVTARFNSDNPVAQYEAVLRESAARSIASSIAMQAERGNFSLDARASDIIVRALNEPAIRLQTKLSLIAAMSTDKIRVVPPAVDQAIVGVVQQISNQSPVKEADLRSCLEYFSHRSPERFASEVEKIYDAHNSDADIRLAVGRYAMTLQKDPSNLTRKLEKTEDRNLLYLMHIRDLRNGKSKQINRELFDALLVRAISLHPDDDFSLSDVIKHLDAVDDDASIEVVGQLIEAIQQFALAKNLSLAVANDSSDDMSFRLFAADGTKASTTLDRDDFRTLIQLATAWIKSNLEQSKGEFTPAIAQAMDFWFPRPAGDAKMTARKAGNFALDDFKKVRFIAPDGSETPGSALPSRAVVTTQRSGAEISVLLKWTDETGAIKSMPIRQIADLDTDSLKQRGIWGRVSDDD